MSDIDARIVRHDPTLDEVDSFGWWSLVMCGERVCSNVGFLGGQNHPVIDEILNLMTQSEAQIGVMTVLLVKCTIFGWVVGSGESFW